jgi:hypothetical protein
MICVNILPICYVAFKINLFYDQRAYGEFKQELANTRKVLEGTTGSFAGDHMKSMSLLRLATHSGHDRWAILTVQQPELDFSKLPESPEIKNDGRFTF